MRRRKVLAGMALAALLVMLPLILSCPTAPTKKMANTIVRLVPGKEQVDPGETFTVQVKIEPAAGANVAGAQFDLYFNPESLDIERVEEGDFLKQGGAPSFFNPGTIDNEAGLLAPVYGVVIGQGQVLPNAGTLAIVHCRALHAPTSSAFALDKVIVGSKDGVHVPLGSFLVGQVAVVLFADVNLDGIVDLDDIAAAAARFGATGAPGFHRADVLKDGVVNVLDLILIGQEIS